MDPRKKRALFIISYTSLERGEVRAGGRGGVGGGGGWGGSAMGSTLPVPGTCHDLTSHVR